MMDSMGINDCLLFIQDFGTDCFCLVYLVVYYSKVIGKLKNKKEKNYAGLFFW